MSKIKKRADIEKTNAFIEGTPPKAEWRVADWSPVGLKKLSIIELEERWTDIENQLEAIDDQAKMMMWFICLRIREEYPSNKLMGEYLEDLRRRNPNHSLGVDKMAQQTRNKWAHAARWCEEMKITSLHEAGLNQKAVFALSAPGNQDVSRAIYQKIKGSHVPGAEVERMIAQAKAVATIEQQPAQEQQQLLEKMSHSDELEPHVSEGSYQKRIPVVNGVAMENAAPVEAEEAEYRDVPTNGSEAAPASNASDQHGQGAAMAERAAMQQYYFGVTDADKIDLDLHGNDRNVRRVLINQLSVTDAKYLTDDEILSELAIMEKAYGRTPMQLIKLYQERIRALGENRYPVREVKG